MSVQNSANPRNNLNHFGRVAWDVRGMYAGCAWDVTGCHAGCTRDLHAREIAREMRVRFILISRKAPLRRPGGGGDRGFPEISPGLSRIGPWPMPKQTKKMAAEPGSVGIGEGNPNSKWAFLVR